MDDQGYNQNGPTPTPPATEPPVISTPLAPFPETPSPVVPSKNKRKKLLVGSIIAAALVILGGGGALAYNFWYQNPEKVVTDAVMNAVKAKSLTYTGSLVTTGDTRFKVELQGATVSSSMTHTAKITFPIADKEHTIEANGLFDDKNDLYLKVKNLDAFIESYRSSVPPESIATLDTLVAKVNDQWIKMSAADMSELSIETAKKQTCITDAIKKYKDDDTASSEVAEVYKNNKFFIIDKKLGSKDGSLGYSIKTDTAKAKAFAKGLKSTTIYKTIHDCDPSLVEESQEEDAVEEQAKSVQKTELWVERWSHTLTKLDASITSEDGKSKSSFIFQPKFNEKVTITAPEKSISLKQLQAEIEELMTSVTAMPELTEEQAAMMMEAEASSEL